MPDWNLEQWTVTLTVLLLLLAVATGIVQFLAWRSPRYPKSNTSLEIANLGAYQAKDLPTIHSTNGIPTLSQLTEGIQLDPARLDRARRLYDIGLDQFNHYVNNRDGLIEEARAGMASLANNLCQAEIAKAEGIGESLAANEDREKRKAAQAKYRDLSPQAQIYAQHKRHETDALRSIARDLETNTPRTDYTPLRARIASGKVELDSILSELPVFWQAMRTLNEKVERPPVRRPPKREFLHLLYIGADGQLLEDKRAERDGDWIISRKHNMRFPYQKPAPLSILKEEGSPPVQVGQIVVVTSDPGSEWATKFWRQGGRLDQEYLRVRKGMAPEQLRTAYRRRLINRAIYMATGVLLIVEVILLGAIYIR